MTDEATEEYGPTKWVHIKHSRQITAPDGRTLAERWEVESHDDLRAVHTMRHVIVQTAAAHNHTELSAANGEDEKHDPSPEAPSES